jgi:cardiolipin synthase
MILTLILIGVIPFLLTMIQNQQWLAALLLFVCAAITDILDGFFARLLAQQTVLGSYLDPIADKLLTMALFGMFAYESYVSKIMVALLVVKELLLLCGAVYIRLKTGRLIVIPTIWGKAAMFSQVCFTTLFLIARAYQYTLSRFVIDGSLMVVVVVHGIALWVYYKQGKQYE